VSTTNVTNFEFFVSGQRQLPEFSQKVCSVVAAHLRAPNIRLAAYLDDWFVVNQNKQMLMEDREKTLNLLINLGFIVNLEKSNLIPTQTITYIGAMFCLKEGIVRPSPRFLCRLTALIKLLVAVQRQRVLYIRKPSNLPHQP
jgi:hypothetical protein